MPPLYQARRAAGPCCGPDAMKRCWQRAAGAVRSSCGAISAGFVDLARAAVERGALLDRQVLRVDVALDLGARMQHDLGAENRAADAPVDIDGIGGDCTLNLRFLADFERAAVQVGLDVAVDPERALAADGDGLALDREVVADDALGAMFAVGTWPRCAAADRSLRLSCGTGASAGAVRVCD